MAETKRTDISTMILSLTRWFDKVSEAKKEARDFLIVMKVTADMTILGENFNLRKPKDLQELRTALSEWIAINGLLHSDFKRAEASRRYQLYPTS